jgi:cytochrome c-type biogenesis protein
MESVSLAGAFLAGLLSFLSPCILPLIPAYICAISGVSFEQLSADQPPPLIMKRVIAGALLFGLGFTVVFVLLGISATMVGKFLYAHMTFLKQAAGVVVMVFGLLLSGLISFDFLNREKRFRIRSTLWRPVTPLILGSAFAFGWTPCVGPILGVILTYASMRPTVDQGALLLITYSLGLGVPFLFAALAINSFLRFFARIRNWLKLVQLVAGLLLVGLGVLILTDNLERLTYWLGP